MKNQKPWNGCVCEYGCFSAESIPSDCLSFYDSWWSYVYSWEKVEIVYKNVCKLVSNATCTLFRGISVLIITNWVFSPGWSVPSHFCLNCHFFGCFWVLSNVGWYTVLKPKHNISKYSCSLFEDHSKGKNCKNVYYVVGQQCPRNAVGFVKNIFYAFCVDCELSVGGT